MKEVISKLKEKFNSIQVLESMQEYTFNSYNEYYFTKTDFTFRKDYIKNNELSSRFDFKISKNNSEYSFTISGVSDILNYSNTLKDSNNYTAKNIDELIKKIEFCLSDKYIIELYEKIFEVLELSQSYLILRKDDSFTIQLKEFKNRTPHYINSFSDKLFSDFFEISASEDSIILKLIK